MKLREVLERLAKGDIDVKEAEMLLRMYSLEEVENTVKYDLGREIRRGLPEVVLCEGKTSKQVLKLVKKILEKHDKVILSRANSKLARELKKLKEIKLEVFGNGRTLVVKKIGSKLAKSGGKVGIITAGTSDKPIAEECEAMLKMMGCEVHSYYDVGIAGIHRLFKPLKDLVKKDVDVIVVFAGMEGALPSVVAGLVDIPVIGVPISTGYGYGGKGEAALMTMLQNCSLGLAVVNIDSGIGAGAIAGLIANRVAKFKKDLMQET